METIVGHNCGNFKGHGSENYWGDSQVNFFFLIFLIFKGILKDFPTVFKD